MKFMKISLLIFVCLGIFVFDGVLASSKFPLLGKIVYIDSGHGGVDPGAVYRNVKESDITLSISEQLAIHLEYLGAIVYMTRDGNYDLASSNAVRRKLSDLSNRADLINNSDCDIYISIHLNAEASTEWYGAQAFYSSKNKNNIFLAEIMQNEFQKKGISKREIKEIKDAYMYKNIKKTGVLLELGFISNYNDRKKLLDKKYQENLAKIISEGIINYFG